MSTIHYEEFRSLVLRHYREIESGNPGYQSTEWFLLRYLSRIAQNTTMPTTPEKVENSMRGFIRYYVDRIDTQSPLGERCVSIYAEYRKTRREKPEV